MLKIRKTHLGMGNPIDILSKNPMAVLQYKCLVQVKGKTDNFFAQNN